MTLRGVLFDVDGTLVDSVDAHTRAWVAAFEADGYRVDPARIRGMIGMGGDKMVPAAIGVEQGSEIGRRVAERRRVRFRAMELPTIRATRGARELLDALRRSPVRIGIATSAEAEELRDLLRIVDATDLLDAAADAGDVGGSKPDPDVIHAALAKMGIAAADAVLVGDTAYDIEAAARASVPTIALRCGGWRDEDLAGAVALRDDPADLLACFDGTPLAGLLAAAAATART